MSWQFFLIFAAGFAAGAFTTAFLIVVLDLWKDYF